MALENSGVDSHAAERLANLTARMSEIEGVNRAFERQLASVETSRVRAPPVRPENFDDDEAIEALRRRFRLPSLENRLSIVESSLRAPEETPMSRSESQTSDPQSVGSVFSHALAEAREGVADGTAAGFAETAGRSLCRRAVQFGASESLMRNTVVLAIASMLAPFLVLLAVAMLGERLGTKGPKLQRYAERAIRGTVTTHTATATTFLLDWCGELLASLADAEPTTQQASQP
jgi:hypothetical protein